MMEIHKGYRNQSIDKRINLKTNVSNGTKT